MHYGFSYTLLNGHGNSMYFTKAEPTASSHWHSVLYHQIWNRNSPTLWHAHKTRRTGDYLLSTATDLSFGTTFSLTIMTLQDRCMTLHRPTWVQDLTAVIALWTSEDTYSLLLDNINKICNSFDRKYKRFCKTCQTLALTAPETFIWARSMCMPTPFWIKYLDCVDNNLCSCNTCSLDDLEPFPSSTFSCSYFSKFLNLHRLWSSICTNKTD